MMCSKYQSRLIIIPLYIIIVIESFTIGVLIDHSFDSLTKYTHLDVQHRDAIGVLLMTLIVIAISGHLITIPFLCYATHNHTPTPLIPYMAWRFLLSAITLALLIWQSMTNNGEWLTNELSKQLQQRIRPIAFIEVIIGAIFFILTLRAHHYFVLCQTHLNNHIIALDNDNDNDNDNDDDGHTRIHHYRYNSAYNSSQYL